MRRICRGLRFVRGPAAYHFTPEVFDKSQKYGRHKAKFSLFSGFYKQLLDTAQIQSGLFYPWTWAVSGCMIQYFGYGPEYQVRYPADPSLKTAFI